LVRLPAPVPSLAGRAVVLGLRPEQLHAGADALLQVDVEMVESLGADHLIHARAGGQDLIVRCGGGPLPVAGQRVGLGFSAAAMHWFDPAGTQRIELA
jgi:sn-glycerol 3-phosphate transport system ATP-binding protein